MQCAYGIIVHLGVDVEVLSGSLQCEFCCFQEVCIVYTDHSDVYTVDVFWGEYTDHSGVYMGAALSCWRQSPAPTL